jgi:RecA-family ATPase
MKTIKESPATISEGINNKKPVKDSEKDLQLKIFGEETSRQNIEANGKQPISPSNGNGKNRKINPHFDLSKISLEDIKKDAEKLVQANNENNAKGIYSATELLDRNIFEIPTLLDPILPKVGLCALAGSSDVGKSSFLRQLAIAVSLGEPEFLGFKLNTEHKRAIYAMTEDDDLVVSVLLQKANLGKKLSHESYIRLSFIFDTSDLVKRLDNLLAENKADLIIIDSFTDLYGKSMNDANQVRTFLNEYSQLAQKHKCLIIFMHHTGKHTDGLIPSKHNLLGSQGFEAKMRLVIELRADQFQPDKRHLCIVKANYLPKEYKNESYVLFFDNNFQFSMTDDRVLFEELKAENKTEIKEMVKNMKEDGKTQEEIASQLKISQSTVSRYLKE